MATFDLDHIVTEGYYPLLVTFLSNKDGGGICKAAVDFIYQGTLTQCYHFELELFLNKVKQVNNFKIFVTINLNVMNGELIQIYFCNQIVVCLSDNDSFSTDIQIEI